MGYLLQSLKTYFDIHVSILKNSVYTLLQNYFQKDRIPISKDFMKSKYTGYFSTDLFEYTLSQNYFQK